MEDKQRQERFLADMTAFLVREANIAAFPYWEGVELRFDGIPEETETEPQLRLTARLRLKPDILVGEICFPDSVLRRSSDLPARVVEWVHNLPVDRKARRL